MTTIAPMKCSRRGVEFTKEQGGICYDCEKPFCVEHLWEVKRDDEMVYLCEVDKGGLEGKKGRNSVVTVRSNYGLRLTYH